jgi:transposase-like protein
MSSNIRRVWSASEKAAVVMEGLKGRLVIDICADYQISQSMYYKWRDQFIANASKAFEMKQITRTEERLIKENQRLKGVIGELTLELKKNDW